jgi:hypothetical protein
LPLQASCSSCPCQLLPNAVVLITAGGGDISTCRKYVKKILAKNLFGASRKMLACATIAIAPLVITLLCSAVASVRDLLCHRVYIAMNNEEQDVKKILVLQNWMERIRKEVTNKVLSIKRISDFLNFPILAQPTLKKI